MASYAFKRQNPTKQILPLDRGSSVRYDLTARPSAQTRKRAFNTLFVQPYAFDKGSKVQRKSSLK